MSLLLLIDGYNVVAPVAPPGRIPDPTWLQRERNQLVRRLVKHLSEDIRKRTCIVFDAANPPTDRPSEFDVDGIQVRFAVDYPEADDLLEQIITSHSAPKNLAVVSSDHRVQTAANRRGSQTFDSQPWLDDLMDGRIGLAPAQSSRAGQGSEANSDKPDSIDDDDVQQWMSDFGF
jgi:predicted RNA-binding protein with PIN domain